MAWMYFVESAMEPRVYHTIKEVKNGQGPAPIRTEAGLWAIVEVWSDFRDAFTPQDVKLLERLAGALARKTPTP